MTAREMAMNIGKVGMLRQGDFSIAVMIQDARIVFGRVDFQVEAEKPSTGSAWVDAARVKVQG